MLLILENILQIFESKHFDKLDMLLSWKEFGESISWHLICWNPFHKNSSILDFLTKPMVMDVDVPQLRA